jgi:hypothetical protein
MKYVNIGATYIFAIFLIASAIGTVNSIVSGEAMNFSTGYPETEAQNFVAAVIETGWILEFISVVKLLAGILILIPSKEKLGVVVAFPYSIGMLLWGLLTAQSHLVIMVAIFVLNSLLVKKHWEAYKPLVGAK